MQDPDEDLIEATIRRVAASKAARLPDVVSEESADAPSSNGTGAPDLHLVQEDEKPARAAAPARPAADESLIEATLRRIEAQQAARAAEAAGDAPADVAPVEEAQTEREPVPDIHLVRPDEDERTEVPSPRSAPAASSRTNLALAAEPEADASETPDPADIVALRRDLDETRRQLRELTARVDAMLASGAAVSEPTGRRELRPAPKAAPAKSADDDWDDAPVINRIDTGIPPRPAIIRDPAPAAKPAAPPRAEVAPSPAPAAVEDAPKKGFDLLPRTYRITVEDKRRGVDLVPLHRALLGMEGVKDMSLLSYSNGTAIVALEATTELSPDALGAAVAHAMARETKVEVHNEQTMVVKLAED